MREGGIQFRFIGFFYPLIIGSWYSLSPFQKDNESVLFYVVSIPILNCNCRMRRAIERLRTDAILRAHAKGLRAADRWKDVWQPNIRIWNIYFILNFFQQLGQTFLVQKHHHPQNPLETFQERFWWQLYHSKQESQLMGMTMCHQESNWHQGS